MKRLLTVLTFVALALGVGSMTHAAVLTVGQDGWQVYTTIQAAVDNAVDGDVIKVFQGIYREQVVIRDLDDLLIDGEQATITVPESGMTGQLVKIVNCQEFNFRGFTIDGKNGVNVTPGARNSGGDTDTRFYGLFVIDSSGQIVENTVSDVSWGNGVQQGLGMYIQVNDGALRGVNIRENIITNFQKNGITVYGPVKAKIHKNTVTGWGDTDVIAQNCIQLGGDAEMTASLTSNVVSKSNYTGEGWASTGILALWGNDNIRVVRNSISDTMIGVYVYPGSTRVKIINNSGSGNTWDFYSYEDDTKDHANKFEE